MKETKWTQFTSRELTEEEQKEYPEWCWILDCETPDDGQEILVSDGRRVWVDCYCNEGDDGVYLDGGCDVLGLWWMPLPDPPKAEEGEQ